MRQYYDVACLLGNKEVQEFIGTEDYQKHKKIRFPAQDFEIPVGQNEAFLISDTELRDAFTKRFAKTKDLYYKGQPSFESLLDIIKSNIGQL